ncbi:MAG: MBL fold metallo-hydrolase, partial [Nanoarchaeota archaeon]
MDITFLGTGTSYGVPILACNCSTCTSSNPKNVRYRSSICIKINNQALLIDTPPEMRLQLLDNNINDIDAILFTHSHADHIMGLDDIRIINKIHNKTIPCYGNSDTLHDLKKIFNYIFNPTQIGGGIPRIKINTIKKDFFYIDN